MGKEEQLRAREQELCEVMNTVRDDRMKKKQGSNKFCQNTIWDKNAGKLAICQLTFFIDCTILDWNTKKTGKWENIEIFFQRVFFLI